MEIREPCCITSRLLPGVRIGDSEISIGYSDQPGLGGRTRYRYYIDTPAASVESDDLQSGCCGGTLRSGLESLLGFLGAFAESVQYESRTERKSENADLFPASLAEWAVQNSDELGMLAIEVEETDDCIVE